MKILQVINAYSPPYSSGGPAFVTHNISKALAKRGNEVTVYTTNALSRDRMFEPQQNPTHDDGVKVHYFKNTVYKPSSAIYFSKELVEEFKKNVVEYDMVHLHEYRSYMGILTSHYAQKYGVPYVLQAHGSLPRIMAQQSRKLIYDSLCGYNLLRNASKVIALTQTEVQQYKSMGVPGDKIKVIPNGVDLEEYRNLPPLGSFRRKYSIGEDTKIILFLGRIHKIKGLDFLIRAYVYLLKEFRFSNVLLVVAGPDEGALGELKRLLSTNKITGNRVLFTGPLCGRDKIEAYVDADVFVLPSRYETFPNVVLEAYACSKPVVASNVESISDIVIHGETGFLFSVGDVRGLAKMISYMLKHSEEAEEMGRKGKAFVKDGFAIEKVVAKLEEIYRECLEYKKGLAFCVERASLMDKSE